MINKLLLTLLLTVPTFAAEPKIQNRDISTKDMKAQNKIISKLAAQELNSSLPQKIDKYTTLIKVRAQDTTIVYIFELNIAPKTDKAVQKEDHDRMKEAVTRGTCITSKKFLDADISLKYIYTSATTKKELFQFNINQKSCFKL